MPTRKNAIITGSGRSGTSMVAGLFGKSDYYMGPNLIGPVDLSPKGQFESRDINSLNTAILENSVPDIFISDDLRDPNNGWLYEVPPEITVPPIPKFANQIKKFTSHSPFCFKDPRFSYTLPAWLPFLTNCVYICVFREPEKTISSLLPAAKLYSQVTLSRERAASIWSNMYTHIFNQRSICGPWLFVHYNQVVQGNGTKRIQDLTHAELDLSFPDKSISISKSEELAPPPCQEIYSTLCRLAGYPST